MAHTVSSIFKHTTDDGKEGVLGIDEEAHLYWNGQPVVTEQKVKLSRLVNFSLIIGSFSTAVIAIFTVLTYCKS